MMKVILLALVFSLYTAIPAARAADGDDALGLWNTEEKDAIIELFKCGEKYCGRVFWVKEPNYSARDKNGREGQPKLDNKNPDPNLRSRPIVGLQIMHDFSFTGSNTWTGGKMYDPESGKTYSGRISLTSPNTLNLRGYVLFSLFGRTTTWTRRASAK